MKNQLGYHSNAAFVTEDYEIRLRAVYGFHEKEPRDYSTAGE
jgi:hypothetical protein